MFYLSVFTAAVQVVLAVYLMLSGLSPWPCVAIAILMIGCAFTQAERPRR